MKRFRLGTLMLLVAIAALVDALVVQHDRASRRIALLEAVAAPALKSSEMIVEKRSGELQIKRLKKGVNEPKGSKGMDR